MNKSKRDGALIKISLCELNNVFHSIFFSYVCVNSEQRWWEWQFSASLCYPMNGIYSTMQPSRMIKRALEIFHKLNHWLGMDGSRGIEINLVECYLCRYSPVYAWYLVNFATYLTNRLRIRLYAYDHVHITVIRISSRHIDCINLAEKPNVIQNQSFSVIRSKLRANLHNHEMEHDPFNFKWKHVWIAGREHRLKFAFSPDWGSILLWKLWINKLIDMVCRI